jgi:acetylornithine/succinyldiaminopimelate/putrescine aminotransferase
MVRARGNRLWRGLERLPVRNLRGAGLMIGFDVPDAPALARRALCEQRLVVNATGPDTIRLLPPLTVAPDEIDDALGRLAALLASGGR